MSNDGNYCNRNKNSFKMDNWMDNEYDCYDDYQFGQILSKGKKRTNNVDNNNYGNIDDSFKTKSEMEIKECCGVQKRPLSDITLAISNTNERDIPRTFIDLKEKDYNFTISPCSSIISKEEIPNASSVYSTKSESFFNGQSDFLSTSVKNFEMPKTTQDSTLHSSDSFKRCYNLSKMDDENGSPYGTVETSKNLEDRIKLEVSKGVSGNNFNVMLNEASSSSSPSYYSCPISEDNSLLALISQGSFCIDPQRTSQHIPLFSKPKSDKKSPSTYKLKKHYKNVKRKLKFTSDLGDAKIRKNSSQNKLQTDHGTNTQSSISDFFKIQKFSQNEAENNNKISLTDKLAVENVTESTDNNCLNISDYNINLKPTINDYVNKDDAVFERQHSSILKLSYCTPDSQSNSTDLTDSEKKIKRKMLEISKNQLLVYTGPKVVFDNLLKKNKNQEILKGIQEELSKFIVSLIEVDDYNSLQSEMTATDRRISKPRLSLPYDSKKQQKRSSVIIYLLGKIYTLINNNAYCSQRQIYYELKKYVPNQEYIARCSYSISLLLKVEPWYLPITASGTGLIFGNLTIYTANDVIINCRNSGGTLIPQDVLQIKAFRSDAVFILVVEKDSVFQKLLDEEISKTLATSCIVITGKGFPDYKTRLFTKLLWRHLRIPIFVLTDGDPYGIEIMLTYRFGSIIRPHFLEDIIIPEIRWIGILPSDIERLQIPYENLNESELAKLRKMINRPYVQEYDWLKREIKVMLRHKKKAGIEGVLDNHKSLTKFYLVSKLFSGDFF